MFLRDARKELIDMLKARAHDMAMEEDYRRMRPFKNGQTYYARKMYTLDAEPFYRSDGYTIRKGDPVYFVRCCGYVPGMSTYWKVITPNGRLYTMMWRCNLDFDVFWTIAR